MGTHRSSSISLERGIADWFEQHGSHQVLRRDAASSVCSGGLLYLSKGSLLINFSLTADGASRGTAALLFDGEVLDLNALRFVPRGALRAIGGDTEYYVYDGRNTIQTRVPLEMMDRLGSFAGRLARQTIMNSTLDIDERLCTLLVKLAVRFGTQKDGCIEFDLPMARDTMAMVLGVRSESLSRAISQAKSSGLIDLYGRSQVTVLDWKTLCSKSPISNLVIAANTR